MAKDTIASESSDVLPQQETIPLPYTKEKTEIFKYLKVDPDYGLSDSEVKKRIKHYGENKLKEKPKRSKILLFIEQFKSILILVLIGAAIIAGAVGEIKDAIVIMIVVVFNAFLGFWQEYRAEKALDALKKMVSPTARVRREGKVIEVPVKQLVLGDIVILESGDRVPADGRLIIAHNLEVDESSLTGESFPVRKDPESVLPKTCPLAERINMTYMNSVVTRGRGEMIVTATGIFTEIGKISGMLAEAKEEQTPLQIQLNELGCRLALIVGIVIGVIFLLGLLRNQPFIQVFITSIALAVAAIPEGLPAVVTVTLSLGMYRMAKHHAIVKRLSAVETLGYTSVICTDKTGTLTLNQMTARAIVYLGRRFSVSGEGYEGKGKITAEDGKSLPDFGSLLYPAILANDSKINDGQLIGDPTDGALLALAMKAGIKLEELIALHPRIAEIPFDSSYKFQVSFHKESSDSIRLYIKGALDVLLKRSSTYLSEKGEIALDEQAFDYWMNENNRLGSSAMRVIACATRLIPESEFKKTDNLINLVQNLTFLGLVGIIDPPRPEARDAIALCKKAGIEVKVITGDHKITAAAIARELGLQPKVIEGKELDEMTNEELKQKISELVVVARVTPEHKVRIVQALKANGHVVAMTGDGVNDAPALKNADIGVAMGITGTEVTKEAATMVLTDDNFATIVRAVQEGRAIYENIIKFVRFQLSTNVGAILTVFGSSLIGWASPFTPIQILFINIILDGPPAMSLGIDPARSGIMNEPPRKMGASILTLKRLANLFFAGLIMAAGTLFNFTYARPQGEIYALTLSFTTFVFFQLFNLLNARNEHGSVFNSQFFANPLLILSIILGVLLQIVVVHWSPAQNIFRTTDLQVTDWLRAVTVASSILIIEEVRKFVSRKIPGLIQKRSDSV